MCIWQKSKKLPARKLKLHMKNLIIVLVAVMFSLSANAQTTSTVTTDSTSNSSVNTDAESRTIVISPPPSAISPGVGSSSSDLCTVGVSGAVQTQILGISTGEMVRDENCERLKISKTLYDMGMKVAAVSVMCQDRRVFDAMQMAGTPCPYFGDIGQKAQMGWDNDQGRIPEEIVDDSNKDAPLKAFAAGGLSIGLLFLLL